MKNENIFAISIGVLLIFTLLFEAATVMVNPPEVILTFNTNKGEVRIQAEIADGPAERSHGLMHRTELCKTCGMLFIFDSEETVSFWMKNTLIPLDMVFVSEAGEIVNIHENVPPCEAYPCPSYLSDRPIKYVIEVNAGFAEENGVEVGDTIHVNS